MGSPTPVKRISEPSKSANAVFFDFGSSTSELDSTHVYAVLVLLSREKVWIQGYLHAQLMAEC